MRKPARISTKKIVSLRSVLAITIAKERPDVKVYASDVDPNALELAKENAEKQNPDTC